jgi:hypothetical protein
MSGAKAVKTEIQVRYDSLLEFSSVARRLMSRYTSVTQEIRIQNQNQVDERIILGAPEEGYFFDCTWERAAFVGEGERQNYRRKDGKTRFFFSLIEDISSQDFFNRFDGMAVATFDVIPLQGEKISLEDEEIGSVREITDPVVQAFSDRFLGDGLLPPRLKDAGIILEHREGNFQITTQFGPFLPEKDIESRDLIVFGQAGGTPNPDWAVVPSLLVRTEVIYSGTEVSHDTFLECDEKRENIVERIAESSDSLL